MKAIKHHGETYSSDDLRYEGLVKKKERQGERITEETVMIWKGIFLMYSDFVCLFSCFLQRLSSVVKDIKDATSRTLTDLFALRVTRPVDNRLE